MAYAAVASLVRILDELLHSDKYAVNYPKPQIESLYGKICNLQSFLEDIFPIPRGWRIEVNDLEIQIRDAIYKAEDSIEFFISRQTISPEFEEIPGDRSSISLLVQDLQEIIAKLEPIIITAEKIRGSIRESKEQRGYLMSEKALPSKSISSSRRTLMMGRENDLSHLLDVLMARAPQLIVVAITGLPGIVSEEYSVGDILLQLIAQCGRGIEMWGRSDDELAEHLYKLLLGRRYLIVMDDIWDEQFWDQVKYFFPGNGNGSCIVLTSRNAAFARFAEFHHVMRPLDQEMSWMLLCEEVFGGDCPSELEDVGRNIAANCGGIPLSIVVVGGLLALQPKTVESWKTIEEDVHNAAAKGGESYLDVLSLSYNNLPPRLKACFLYMGAFAKDSEILVSKIIKFWVAEGFLTPSSLPWGSLEQVAEQHLKDLIDRNLISVHKIGSDGRAKTCSIPGNLRQFAVQECQKEFFFYNINRCIQEISESERRISVHKNILMCIENVYQCTKSIKLARTLLYAGPNHHHPLPFCLTFELLRVLDALTVYFIELPDALFELIHLRYLAFTYDEDPPPLVSNLRNLLILIVRQHPKIILRRASVLPVEIWNMPQIRHLMFTESFLPDPSGAEIHAQNSVLLENLQSLSNVNAACCAKGVLQNMPNLKKLGIWIEAPAAVHFYLDQLQCLEALKFTVLKPIPGEKIDFLPELNFPRTLRKLNLRGCGIPWEDMKVIEELPYLEVLKLREFAFQGPRWCPIEGGFPKLRFLLLESLDLKKWAANDSHFPCLERLIIRHCYELEGIPWEIVGMAMLELIEMVDCSPAAVKCAELIREERVEWGEVDFQLRIHSSWE